MIRYAKRAHSHTHIHTNTDNHNPQTSKVPLDRKVQGTSSFTSAASNQRDCPGDSPWEVQIRLPEGDCHMLTTVYYV